MHGQTAFKRKIRSDPAYVDDENEEQCLNDVRTQNTRDTPAARRVGLLPVTIFLILARVAFVISAVGRILFDTVKHHTKEIFFQKF